jgi:NAD(P)-dependent dehydrogenase (short-subunit alcohol dehydrogenase family)
MSLILERLDGRVALVTGATRGIGRAIAVRLGSLGADVIVGGSGRDQDGLAETRRLVEAQGVRSAPLEADLTVADERERLIREVQGHFGPVDVLVNNAGGILSYASPGTIVLADRIATFELNFHAPLDLIHAVLPAMRTAGWGRIVNVTSKAAQQSLPPYVEPMKMNYAIVTYGAAKAALNRATEGFAAELAGTGVHVNAVTPQRICASEGAMDLARAVAGVHPDWIESVEMMSEAVAVLIASSRTGIVASSREVLAASAAPLRSLDGSQIIGNASSYPDIRV